MRFPGVALAALLASCSAPLEAVADQAALVVDGASLKLVLRASTDTVRPGAVDTLRVTLTSSGLRPVTLHFGSSCQMLIYIRDARGDIVLPDGGGWLCEAVLTGLTIPAGQAVLRDFLWSGGTAFTSEMPMRALPAGTYYATAEVTSGEGTLRTAPRAVVVEDGSP